MRQKRRRKLRLKFTKFVNVWLADILERHLRDKDVFAWNTNFLIDNWFSRIFPLKLKKRERLFLLRRLIEYTRFTRALEKGHIERAIKFAQKKWHRELTDTEIRFFLRESKSHLSIVVADKTFVVFGKTK